MTNTTVRKQKSGDQLVPGDWLAPGEALDGAAEVLFALAYPAGADRSRDNDGTHIQLVLREQGAIATYPNVVSGNTLFDLASDEDLAERREAVERAARIADLRALADWLETNPWAPIPNYFEAAAHLDERHIGGPNTASAYATVREVAARLGVEPEERLDDRSQASRSFGRLRYQVIAWHPDGRPVAPAVSAEGADGVAVPAEDATLTRALVTQECVFVGKPGFCTKHNATHTPVSEAECGCPVYPFYAPGRGDPSDTLVDHRVDCGAHPYNADSAPVGEVPF